MTLNDLLLSARLAMPRHNVAALCRELGVTRTTFYKWEKWEETGNYPSDDNIEKLAKIANTSIEAATFAVYSAKARNPLVSKVFAQHAALF